MHQTQDLMTEINITPFTDVILVLLIIFIIATPLISQNNINVKLPDASSKDTIERSRSVFITISAEGVVYLEDKVLTNKALKDKVNSLLAIDKDYKFVVAADKACRFQEVVKVIDTLQGSGVKSLNIATKSNDVISHE